MVKQRSFAIFSVVFAAVFVVLLVMLLVTGYSIEKFTGQAETFFAAYSHIDGMNEMKGHFASLTKDAALEFFILTGAALLTTLVLVSGASYVIVYNMLLLPVLRIHTGIQEIIKGNFPKVFSAPASAGADLLVERLMKCLSTCIMNGWIINGKWLNLWLRRRSFQRLLNIVPMC